MSRGKKLDIFIGANFEDGWSQIKEENPTKTSQKILPPKQHTLVFKKEKRRGKVVTLVGEFFLDKKEANTLLKSLKKQLGCGGSFKNGWMEFQGELKEKLKELLQKSDFKFKH
ncbi:Translation initiation factor SUI1 [hydrothermal vent metagenome]|uniref:Translation initiation factor SUI1 n=1 Tax=hydrothermal vent metagenome TaxID=652676 RepID=A0A1W1D3B5_9ZZZZ